MIQIKVRIFLDMRLNLREVSLELPAFLQDSVMQTKTRSFLTIQLSQSTRNMPLRFAGLLSYSVMIQTKIQLFSAIRLNLPEVPLWFPVFLKDSVMIQTKVRPFLAIELNFPEV